MAEEITALQSTIKREIASSIGSFSSEMYNNFLLSTIHDIGNLVSTVNTLSSEVVNLRTFYRTESSFLKKRIIDLEKDIAYKKTRAARLSQTVDDWVDFHETARLSHPTSQPDNLKALINSRFGEVTLPAIARQSKFYTQSLSRGVIVPAADLQVTTTSVFDKLEGDGVVNYENGGTVKENDARKAFDGSLNSTWTRRVEFPLDSNVSEVEVELTVQIPDQSVAESNLISVLPFPYGEIDVTGLYYSPDLSSSFQMVPGFSATNNSRNSRYHFSSRVVSQIKIRLRQRNWHEENGKRVFLYGLNELDCSLVEWDKTYVEGGDIDQNSTFIVSFDAPEDYKFGTLRSINFDPDFTQEDITKRHIHVVLSSTPDLGNPIWNSDTTEFPQNLTNGVAVGDISRLYAIITLNYVSSSGGFDSPYEIGTPPVLHGMGLQYTVTS